MGLSSGRADIQRRLIIWGFSVSNDGLGLTIKRETKTSYNDGRFYTGDASSVTLDVNLANNVSSSAYASCSSSSIETGTRRIIRLVEWSHVVHLERRTTEHSSTRRIIHLLSVFLPDELPDASPDGLTFVRPSSSQTDYAYLVASQR